MMFIDINYEQARELLSLFPDDRRELCYTLCEGDETFHSGPGLYAYVSDYPDEGCFFLGKGTVF